MNRLTVAFVIDTDSVVVEAGCRMILPCTCGRRFDVSSGAIGSPHWCAGTWDRAGVHGYRGHCVYWTRWDHRRPENPRPFIGGRVVVRTLPSSMVLPFPPRSDARTAMSPRRPASRLHCGVLPRAAHRCVAYSPNCSEVHLRMDLVLMVPVIIRRTILDLRRLRCGRGRRAPVRAADP